MIPYIFLIIFLAGGVGQSHADRAETRFVRKHVLPEIKVPAGLSCSKDKLFVLEPRSDAPIVYWIDPEQLRIKKQMRLVQKERPLRQAVDIVTDARDRLYIRDAQYNRIVVFDANGRLVRELYLSREDVTLGMAIDSRGRIILNTPRAGSLFAVLGPDGKVLSRTGALLQVPRVYTGYAQRYIPPVPLSRMRFTFGPDGFLYVTYFFAPIVQKYDEDLKLVWEKRLQGEHADRLIRRFWEDPRSGAVLSVDGVQLALMASDIAVDDQFVYVLLADDYLYVIDHNGEYIETRSMERLTGDPGVQLYRICSAAGRLFAISWRGLFVLEWAP